MTIAAPEPSSSDPTSTAPLVATPVTTLVPTRVWDLPTRVFHVALVLAVAAAIVTAKLGDRWMPWHLRCGETVLTLVAFRWAWGFLGGHWSRFAQFLPSPARAWRHLRGADASPVAGHNPLGAFSVWAFMLLLTVQVATGLVADDDIDTVGPLNAHVGEHVARRASGWHAVYGANLLMALIALHVLAVAWHVWGRHEPLLRAMASGDKPLPPSTQPSRDTARTRVLALALWLAALAGVLAMLRFAA